MLPLRPFFLWTPTEGSSEIKETFTRSIATSLSGRAATPRAAVRRKTIILLRTGWADPAIDDVRRRVSEKLLVPRAAIDRHRVRRTALSVVADFTLDRDRIRIADVVLVYLERAYATPGVVPLGTCPDRTAPRPWRSPREESSSRRWRRRGHLARLSGDRPGSPVTVRVRIDEPQPIDAITGEAWDDSLAEDPRNFLVCPPDSSLAGRPFPAAADCSGATRSTFTLFAGVRAGRRHRPAPAPAEFVRITGRDPPLDPAAAFTGRRLP